MNALVLTCNHCDSVRFVSLPFGAFKKVPSAIAFLLIEASSSGEPKSTGCVPSTGRASDTTISVLLTATFIAFTNSVALAII